MSHPLRAHQVVRTGSSASCLASLVVGVLGCTEPVSTLDASIDTSDVATSDAPIDVQVPPDAFVPGPLPPRRFLTDELGRALILHGTQDGSGKDDPLRTPSLTEDDVARMADDWGLDFFRYLVFWDALEPAAGVIDEAYLDRIETRLDWFAAHGIHVMLDMHQDVYARRFCCDGAPEWAIRDDGEPFALQSTWSLNYFQPAVMRAFDHFWAYEEHRDLQDHYAAAWAALAERFRDHPAVLGYDLMNEPWPGSAFDSRELRPEGAGPTASTAEFDRTLFADFYARVIAAVRAVDDVHWIFVEPRNTAAGGAMQFVPELDDPRDGPSRIVWAPHLYSVRYEASMGYDREADLTVSRWARSRNEETRLHDWPILMGELGMDPSYPGASAYLDDVLQMADAERIGWAYWTFNGSWGFWDPVAGVERAHVAQIVRAYPQRVAGTPTAWSWDRETRRLSLSFERLEGVRGATEIFVPAARFYPEGFEVSSSDADGTWSYTFDETRQRVSIVSSDDTTHTLTIAPR